jgi:hypothetical protein
MTMTTETETVSVDDCGRYDLIQFDHMVGHGQQKPILVIDPANRRCWLETETTSPGAGTPADRWHGLVLTTDIDGDGASVDGAAVVALLRGELQPLLAAICDGHDTVWDGRNIVGRLSADAAAADEELTARLQQAPSFDGGLLDAGDWLQDVHADDLGITRETTDSELYDIADRVDAEALDQRDTVVIGTLDHLKLMRDSIGDDDE